MRNLAGKRVVVTRPENQSRALIQKLKALGAVPVAFPTIAIRPQADQSRLEEALRQLSRYHWLIFTSQNGVQVFWEQFAKQQHALEGLRVAAIGPATARCLEERGVQVDYMPEEYVAEAVAQGIGDVAGKRILLPRAEIARPALVDELTRRGAVVDEIPVYQTVAAEPDPQAWEELERGVDYVTFTSSSTVNNFFQILGEKAEPVLKKAVIACIGPITAATVETHHVHPHIVAEEYTTEGLVQALLDHNEHMTREG